MIDGGRIFFDQPVKNNIRRCKNIRKIAAGQGDDYTTCCLLDYLYFKENNKLIVIDLSKQQAHDVSPKAIQQFSFMGNLDWAGNINVLHYQISQRNSPRFFTRNYKSVVNTFYKFITQNHRVEEKLSNLQLNKLKPARKNATSITAWKVSKYGAFSGPYFPVLGSNTEIYGKYGKYGPEKTPYLDTFHTVYANNS